jgi:hypothetical protein
MKSTVEYLKEWSDHFKEKKNPVFHTLDAAIADIENERFERSVAKREVMRLRDKLHKLEINPDLPKTATPRTDAHVQWICKRRGWKWTYDDCWLDITRELEMELEAAHTTLCDIRRERDQLKEALQRLTDSTIANLEDAKSE